MQISRRRLGRERGTAPASRVGVGVAYNKLGPFQIVLEVDFSTDQVLEAHGVDQKLYTIFVDRGVVIIRDFVKGEAILEPGTTATLHEDAQLKVRIAFFFKKFFDF